MIDALNIFTIIAAWLAMGWVVIQQHERERKTMATQAEVAEELRLLKAQQIKIAQEQSDRFDAQIAKIAELEEAIKNAPASDEVNTALAELKEVTQQLDDVIPDAPEPPAPAE